MDWPLPDGFQIEYFSETRKVWVRATVVRSEEDQQWRDTAHARRIYIAQQSHFDYETRYFLWFDDYGLTWRELSVLDRLAEID